MKGTLIEKNETRNGSLPTRNALSSQPPLWVTGANPCGEHQGSQADSPGLSYCKGKGAGILISQFPSVHCWELLGRSLTSQLLWPGGMKNRQFPSQGGKITKINVGAGSRTEVERRRKYRRGMDRKPMSTVVTPPLRILWEYIWDERSSERRS